MTPIHRTASEEETQKVAGEMAGTLRRGDVVALYGELGAGKTQFVKGLCTGLGVDEAVTSPTFVILNRYKARTDDLYIFHFDLYRVASTEELYDLGYEEFLFGEGISIVEWADRLQSLLPGNRYDVTIGFGEKDNERTISIKRAATKA